MKKLITSLLLTLITVFAFGQASGIFARTTASGTNMYTAPAPSGCTCSSYTDGGRYQVLFTNANTLTTVTLAIGSLPAKTIYNSAGAVPIAGLIKAADEKILIYSSSLDGFRIAGDFTPTTSSQIAASVTDETGTGSIVLSNSPLITTPTGIVKNDVGLGNADNTSDVNKPVSTAQATADALNLKIASNLSDLNNVVTARSSLGLGSAALISSTAGGDLTGTLPNPTLATVNSNTGTFGSATKTVTITVNQKGLCTAISEQTVTPALSSITGFGTGIATALTVNTGSAGAPVLFNGAGGTPSSLVGTNITGTASGLTSGAAIVLSNPRAIYGNNFDGSTALTQIIASTYGGTGNGFTKFTGASVSEKTYTLPNASATILTDNAVVTAAQGGSGAATLTGALVGNGTSAFVGSNVSLTELNYVDGLTSTAQTQIDARVDKEDFATLSFGSTTTWATASKQTPLAKVTATSSFTIDMTSVKSGSRGTLKLTTNTASAVVMTLDTDFTNKSLNTTVTTYTFPALTAQEYYVTYIVDGTTIEWNFGDLTGLNGIYADWVPTPTGFSANPTNVIARYTLVGKMCTCYFFATSGTSNATTFTLTLPFAAANTQVQTYAIGSVVNNGGSSTAGTCRTIVNSNVLNIYNGAVGTAFTNTGGKNTAFVITYETN
jgi:hypothetical protein